MFNSHCGRLRHSIFCESIESVCDLGMYPVIHFVISRIEFRIISGAKRKTFRWRLKFACSVDNRNSTRCLHQLDLVFVCFYQEQTVWERWCIKCQSTSSWWLCLGFSSQVRVRRCYFVVVTSSSIGIDDDVDSVVVDVTGRKAKYLLEAIRANENWRFSSSSHTFIGMYGKRFAIWKD